jgi:hypothetical protein
MTDATRNTLPASLTELARIAKQYSLDTARWHQTTQSREYTLYTRGDGGERFNFSGINEDQAYALGMIFQALPVLVEMARHTPLLIDPDEIDEG